jgi:hypothetical protein
MIMNFSANLLGLDNAATPFGLKAMQSLQELNANKEVASNAQIMFLCLHAAGFNIIPVSVIAIRATQHASDPTDVFLPCMIVTFVGTMTAMFIVSLRQKINLLQPVILMWIAGISAVVALLVWYITTLSTAGVQSFSSILSNGLLLLVFLLIVLGGIYKKIDLFDAFIDGAKNGFDTAIRIVPYLVGIMVAVSMLRISGTFDVIMDGIRSFFAMLGTDTRFVEGLPTALIRPLSGGAARGEHHDGKRSRFVRQPHFGHISGCSRYYLLCGGGLFWFGRHKKHPLFHWHHVTGRPGGHHYSYNTGVSLFWRHSISSILT